MTAFELNVYTSDLSLSFDPKANLLNVNNVNIFGNTTVNIISLSIFKSSIIVITDTDDLRLSVADSYRDNGVGNMFSFSLNGNLLWSADDLLKEHHFPFCNGRILMENYKLSYEKWHGLKFQENHEYFDAFTFADEHYIIDVTENKFLSKVVIRG